jgi:hypothetical protein
MRSRAIVFASLVLLVAPLALAAPRPNLRHRHHRHGPIVSPPAPPAPETPLDHVETDEPEAR